MCSQFKLFFTMLFLLFHSKSGDIAALFHQIKCSFSFPLCLVSPIELLINNDILGPVLY